MFPPEPQSSFLRRHPPGHNRSSQAIVGIRISSKWLLGFSLSPLPVVHVWKLCLQRDLTRGLPDHTSQPTQPTPFNAEKQQLYSELPLDVVHSQPIAKVESSNATEWAQFSRCYPEFLFFWAWSISDGRNGPVNRHGVSASRVAEKCDILDT